MRKSLEGTERGGGSIKGEGGALNMLRRSSNGIARNPFTFAELDNLLGRLINQCRHKR